MKVGIIGAGKMGSQITARLLKDQHEVMVFDPNPDTLAQAGSQGALTFTDLKSLVAKLGDAPVVWMMIPSVAVENEMAELLDALPHGGIIIDGGNSDYRQTKRRAALCMERGVQLIDAGTSGGVLGEANGFSIMVGGDKETVDKIQPIFQSLARPSGWAYFGSAGAGHFTKMVHNAIEYGVMQSYAEGFRLLKEDDEYADLDLSLASQVWQNGSIIASQLNELCGQILRANPSLDGIDGYVAELGEARWALERAGELHIPMPAIQAALDVRVASHEGKVNFTTKLLAALRNAFGGHPIGKPKS